MIDVRGRLTSWAGSLVMRRVRRKGIDLSRISFIPEATKVPLQRHGTDPVPRLAEIRGQESLHKL